MAEAPEFSLQDTKRFLRERWGMRITSVAPVGAGAWSRAFAFTLDGERYVIRWSDVLEHFERDAAAAAFSRDGLPVPPINELGQAFDRYFAIAPFAEGAYLESLPAPGLEAAMPSIRHMLTALQSVDLTGASGFGTWHGDLRGESPSWKTFLLAINEDREDSLIHGWRASLQEHPEGWAIFNRLYERLTRLVDRLPEDRQLIHSDLLNRNVLVKDGEISAVLDWGSSNFGDALFDVVWFMFWQPWYPAFEKIRLAERLLDHYRADPATSNDEIEARLLAYQLHIGLDSISYNAFLRDWANIDDLVAYLRVLAQ